MRTYLFDRAKKLLLNDCVERRAVTNSNMYFEVKNEGGKIYNVTVGYDRKKEGSNFQLSYNCDCEFMSVSGKINGLMCSHILAVIGWLIGIRKKDDIHK